MQGGGTAYVVKLPTAKTPAKRRKRRQPVAITPSKVDKWSRIIFPIVYIVFNGRYPIA